MISIADSGYAIATTVQTDRFHEDCVMVHRFERDIVLPQSTLTEIAYFLARNVGSHVAAQFMLNLPMSKYKVHALTDDDIQRAGILMRQYADSRLDFVDATVIALAERLNIKRVLTVDKRDFQMVRPSHVEAFELLP